MWLAGTHALKPIVWRIAWPPEVVAAFEAGLLTVNNLEMAGILLHFLVLEYLVDVRHLHILIWCDNTSAVSWTAKMSSSTSQVGQALT